MQLWLCFIVFVCDCFKWERHFVLVKVLKSASVYSLIVVDLPFCKEKLENHHGFHNIWSDTCSSIFMQLSFTTSNEAFVLVGCI